MNTILQRIKEAYHLETDAEVADFLEIKPSTLSMQKNRGRLNLKRIIEKCSDLNKNWLLEGTGPMRKLELRDGIKHIPIFDSLVFDNQALDFRNSKKAGNLVADTQQELYEFSPSDEVVGYVVSGNGLAPTLQENDIAFIKLEDSLAADDAIFLISLDEKPVLSRVEEKDDTLVLKSNGESLEIKKKADKHSVIGKLLWIMRRA